MEVVKVREDIVPDQRAHELVVVDQVDAQHGPGDAVNRCAEEIRPRQEVKEQRDGQRNRQDHGQAGRFLQEGILMQQKPHCIKHQYRCEHEQDHREETAQIAFMLPRRPQRCTMQPQVPANGIDKDEEQDWRIREERHDLECRQYRIAQEEQGQKRLILAFRQMRKEQILERDEQREDDIAGNEPVATKQDGQGCADDVREFMR